MVDGEVRFRHPLIRSAVRQAAGPGQVLDRYRALAAAVADPERRLWHRAMSAEGSDEEVAGDLETYARLASGRGAVTVAGAALERAAALTSIGERKVQDLAAAAEIAYEVGLSDEVRRLLQQAAVLDQSSFQGARLAWLRQMISGSVWVEPGATRTFVDIARRMRDGGDPDMALRSLVPIAHRCWWTRTRKRTRQYLVDATTGMGLPDDDPRVLAVIAMAHPEATAPFVLDRVAHLSLDEVTDPVAGMYVGIAAEKVGNFAAGTRFLARAVDGLREQVRLGLLTQALVHYAWSATHSGDWGAAAAAAAEGAGLAHDTRQPQYGLTGELIAGLVTALRGTDHGVEAAVAGPEQKLLAMKGGPLLATAHLARGAAALGEGRHADAFDHLWPVFDEGDEAFHRFMRWPALLDLVESGACSGRAGRMAGVLADLEAVAEESKAPVLRATLECCRPLLAAEDRAPDLFEAALGQDLTGHPFMRARTLYSFGRWLRRHRRSVDARAPLRRSIDLFDALGATLWSEHARQELRAAGETIGHRTPDARDRLTAQEPRSLGSPRMGFRTVTSAIASSSPLAPWVATCTGSSPSSRSPGGRSSATCWRRGPRTDHESVDSSEVLVPDGTMVGMGGKPNVVLVHGAWTDGSCWSPVIQPLQAAGYRVTAPQFPQTSLAADVARLRQVLRHQAGPAVLAGHSYGGQVMTALGNGAQNVAALVYVAAFGLDEGESSGPLLGSGPPSRHWRT